MRRQKCGTCRHPLDSLASTKTAHCDVTGGICPIARCAKTLLNGPCGGSQGGRCEISPDVPCVWALIYNKLESFGIEGNLKRIDGPKDWSKANSGGPRTMNKEGVEP